MALKISCPKASEFNKFIYQNPFHEYLFILLLFSYVIFYQSRISLAPAANSKILRFLLPPFIISIGTRSPSMEKENSQVKRCSFFKKIVANYAINRVLFDFLIKILYNIQGGREFCDRTACKTAQCAGKKAFFFYYIIFFIKNQVKALEIDIFYYF